MPLTPEQVEEIATRAATRAARASVESAAEKAATRAAAEASLTRDQTRDLIAESVRQTLIQLGVESENPLEMQRDFQHLRNWRKSGEEIKRKSLMVVIGTFLTGLIGLIWLGIRGSGSG